MSDSWSNGGNDWPGWDEMRPADTEGWFFGTPRVYVTPTGFGVLQVEWRRGRSGRKYGVLHRWYYKTREKAEAKVERLKAEKSPTEWGSVTTAQEVSP